MRNTLLIGLAVGLAAAQPAAASTYLSAFGLYNKGKDVQFSVAPGTIDTEYDGGFGLGAAFGWRADRGGGVDYRVEGELSYRKDEVKSHRLNGGAALPGSTGDAKTTALMLNGYLDFNTSSNFTPYLGGGLGFAKVDFSGFGVDAIPDVLDDDDTVFAYQLIAGAGFALSPTTELFAEYRYFKTEDADVTTSAATGGVANSMKYESNNVLAGVRFNF